MAVISRPVHRVAGRVSSDCRYRIYTYVLCLKQSPVCQYTSLMVNCLLILPWCTANADCELSSNKSNTHAATTNHQLYTNFNKPIVTRCKSADKSENYNDKQWVNLWLYRLHSLLLVDKISITSCIISDFLQSI